MLKINDRIELITIDHMTHINNLEEIINHGLMPHNNPHKTTDISNQDVNNRRNKLEPIYHHNIHSYVPFYFNPHNAMLFRNQKKYGESIIILGFDPKIIQYQGTIFTNANASCDCTSFFDSVNDLYSFNWDNIFSGSWYQDETLKKEMMAETLIHQEVPIDNLQYIFCQTNRVKKYIIENYELYNAQVVVLDDLFF